MVGRVGFELTQPVATHLQCVPALQLWRPPIFIVTYWDNSGETRTWSPTNYYLGCTDGIRNPYRPKASSLEHCTYKLTLLLMLILINTIAEITCIISTVDLPIRAIAR